MSAAKLLEQARESGLTLSLNPDGGVAWEGPTAAFERLKPQFLLHRSEIVAALRDDAIVRQKGSIVRHIVRQGLAECNDNEISLVHHSPPSRPGWSRAHTREAQAHSESPEQSVAAIRKAMAEENERRRDWHTRPIAEWPDRLEIISAATGERTVIDLRNVQKRTRH